MERITQTSPKQGNRDNQANKTDTDSQGHAVAVCLAAGESSFVYRPCDIRREVNSTKKGAWSAPTASSFPRRRNQSHQSIISNPAGPGPCTFS
jgi:hypothetical protein